MVESHYFEKEGVEQTWVMNILLVTYVTRRQPHGTSPLISHRPPKLTCFLFPWALPLPLLTPILCSITCTLCSKDGVSSVSPRSRGRLWGQRCQSGERAQCPQFQQSPHPWHQASPCQVWHPTSPPPPQQAAVSWSRPCFPGCSEAGSSGQGQGCQCPLQPQQAPPRGQGGLAAAVGPQAWFSECGQLPRGWSLDQAVGPVLNEAS